MQEFTHIRGFHNVRKELHRRAQHPLPHVKYRGTVKLHGTHAAVECTADCIRPMSRVRYINVKSDNAGFAVFCSGHVQQASFRAIENRIRSGHNIVDEDVITLYGEWCGPGIQKGVAVNALPQRQFVIFAVGHLNVVNSSFRYIDALEQFGRDFADASIYSISDAPTYTLDVDFDDESACEHAFCEAERLALEVEAHCPYSAMFNVDGVGEGIVWTPIGEHFGFSNLMWKSKGPKHREVKTSSGESKLTTEKLASIDAFVEFAVTDARLEKGLDHVRALGHEVDMTSTKEFLTWLADDITRECIDELVESSLDWKLVSKQVNKRALAFWKDACSVIISKSTARSVSDEV